MKKTNIYEYYAFGYNYGLIRRNGLFGYETKKAVEMLKNIFDAIDELDLEVTQKVCEDLQEIHKNLAKSSEEKIDKKPSGFQKPQRLAQPANDQK